MERRATIWLHVGPAKTGTKTIQKTLFSHARLLRKNRILYRNLSVNQDYGKVSFCHHPIARALVAGDMQFIEKAFSDIPPKITDIIVSSEGFSKVSRKGFAAFRALLEPRFNIRVIYYARDPISRANSQAQQSIKTGKKTFEQLCSDAPRVSLKRQILTLEKCFGRANVSIRKFNRSAFVDGDLITDFLYAINRQDLVGQIVALNSNESMTFETALNIDTHRRKTGDTSLIRGSDPRFQEGSRKFSLPVKTLDFIQRSASDDLEWVAAKYRIEFDNMKIAENEGAMPTSRAVKQA